MRPALPRLHMKPPSPDLLRYLHGECLHIFSKPKTQRTFPRYARWSTALRRDHTTKSPNAVVECDNLLSSFDAENTLSPSTRPSRIFPNQPVLDRLLEKRDQRLVTWSENSFTFDQLVFESDVSQQSIRSSAHLGRLIDHPKLVDDAQLWLCLLQFQKRVYGHAGVKAILQAMLRRGSSVFYKTFWHQRELLKHFQTAFLQLGLEDPSLIPEIINFARHIHKFEPEWHHFYVKIMHRVASGSQDVMKWHNMMSACYLPTLDDLCWLFDQNNMEFETQKRVYLANQRRDIYERMMHRLCIRDEYQAAAAWHFFLLRHGDVPEDIEVIRPLQQFCRIHDPAKAIRIDKSMLSAGLPLLVPIEEKVRNVSVVARATRYPLHEKSRSTRAKGYNDTLGARWFATTWVSLDVAMSTVHALGVTHIGPLSLQAIALRDTNPIIVYERIEQLRGLGIDIDHSTYSAAIVRFAAERDAEALNALLRHDLHPEGYDDPVLQDSLLRAASNAGHTKMIQLLLKVRACSSSSTTPSLLMRSASGNMDLIEYARTGQVGKLTALLHKMCESQMIVTPGSIRLIIMSLLRPRAQGKKPESRHHGQITQDLQLVVSTLIVITKSGSTVPLTAWHEICRRLGMTGRLEELEKLCLFLVKWYQSGSELQLTDISLSMPSYRHRATLPSDVRNTHPSHPLRRLFPPSFQKSIVEWGFIQSASTPLSRLDASNLVPSTQDTLRDSTACYLWGIRVLRHLQDEGVAVHRLHVRGAIMNRLIVIFGPGRSNRRANRIIQVRNEESLEVMVKNINAAWEGSALFEVETVRNELLAQCATRMERNSRKAMRQALNRAAKRAS